MIIILWSSYASHLIMIMMIIIPRLEQEDRLVRSNGETSTDYPSLKIVQRKDYWWDIGIENIAIINIVIIVARYKTSPQMTRRAITKLSSLRWSKTIMKIHWIFSWLFVWLKVNETSDWILDWRDVASASINLLIQVTYTSLKILWKICGGNLYQGLRDVNDTPDEWEIHWESCIIKLSSSSKEKWKYMEKYNHNYSLEVWYLGLGRLGLIENLYRQTFLPPPVGTVALPDCTKKNNLISNSSVPCKKLQNGYS